MSDGPPTPDRAVSSFLDYFALALIFGVVESLVAGRSWRVTVGLLMAALAFHFVGIKWPEIKDTLGHRFSWVDRVAADNRYRKTAVIALSGCILTYGLIYVRSLRSDLETYAMPRTITDKQADTLREYLSKHKAEATNILIRTHQKDLEATEYGSQIQNAITGSGWNNSMESSPIVEPLAVDFNPGCNIEVASGLPQADPDHDTLTIVRSAFDSAHIYCSSSGEGKGNIVLKIGRRPIKLEHEDTLLFKIGRWMQQAGRQ